MRPVLDEFPKAVAMAKRSFGLAMMVLAVTVGLATQSHAQAPGTVNVVFARAGLIVGAGRGRGVLTYRGRDYPFRVSGLSLGITIGASFGDWASLYVQYRAPVFAAAKDSATKDQWGAAGIFQCGRSAFHVPATVSGSCRSNVCRRA
jgi:hypothetical protein